jgi:hypothetical protein
MYDIYFNFDGVVKNCIRLFYTDLALVFTTELKPQFLLKLIKTVHPSIRLSRNKSHVQSFELAY